jgi:CHAT domain-containing protein
MVQSQILMQKASGSSRPRLHWCPTGAFMFLPLHAAGIYGFGKKESCSDYVVSSYTPTLTALLRAQKSSPKFSKLDAKLSVVAATRAHDVNLPILWHVKDEIDHVQAAAQNARIAVDDSCVEIGATMTDATGALKYANLVHIACHGIQNPANALSSGFHLVDGTMTVSRLMELDLENAFFAFLSACETGKGDENQPDQTIHLAAAMLFVGFRSVVAIMW